MATRREWICFGSCRFLNLLNFKEFSIIFLKIQSVAHPSYCVDTLGASHNEPVGLYHCKSPYNLTKIEYRQTYTLRKHRDIAVELSDSDCLDANHGRVLLYPCHFRQSNQYFRYDIDTMQIICGTVRENLCMDVEEPSKIIFTSNCDRKKKSQKWRWGFVNETMLNNWSEFGKEILDFHEIEDLKNLKRSKKDKKKKKKTKQEI